MQRDIVMGRDRIPKNIKKNLIEKCNQEDTLFLQLRHGNCNTTIYNIQKKMIQIGNWFRILLCNKFEVPFMSVLLTQKCTLRCENCADLIPYYKRPENFDSRKIIFCLKKYLTAVDSVHLLLLSGGESFIYPDLNKVLDFCIHEKRVKRVCVVTNGTVIPDDKICKLLSNLKVMVRVSYYSCVKEKREKTIHFLREHNILVQDLKGQKWFDVGGFEKRGRNGKQLKWIFQHCSMNNCFEINKNNVLFCARQRGGELGLTPKIPRQDYVSLREKSSNCLRQELLQMYDKDFLDTCDYCDGITERSLRIIPGKQIGP